ncbi:MAG: 1,3-propanediol dehydrogenase [Chloroflexi bacterium]|nr:1,3-propanediol dehydrogenase [Chloroflexota bacterium]
MAQKTFTLLEQPARIIFGIGAADILGDELRHRKLNKALIVTDEGVRKSGVIGVIEKSLEKAGVAVEIFDEVRPNSGVQIVEKGTRIAKEESRDVVVGIGGGSSMDTAKAIGAMVTNEGSIQDYEGLHKLKKQPLPIVLLPTTAGTSSEVTLWAVITDEEQKRKMGIGSSMLIPTFAIDDPLLTISQPPNVTAAAGMDALTHAIESYVNTAAQPISECFALEAIKLIGKYLRLAVAKGGNVEARYNMLLGTLMAGLAFHQTRLGNCHALAMPLGGGKWQIPHGLVNAILLPHVMEFNLIGNLDKFTLVAETMGQKTDGLSLRKAAEQAIVAIKELNEDVGICQRLGDFGVEGKDLPEIAGEAIKSGNIAVNPRQTNIDDLISIAKKAL